MKLYRYTENYFGTHDTDYTVLAIVLLDYNVLKQTDKTYLIETKQYLGDYPNFILRKRYILKTSKKKFAEETPELALIAYIKRKEKQLQILENRVDSVKGDKYYAEELLLKTVGCYVGEINLFQKKLKEEYKKKIEYEVVQQDKVLNENRKSTLKYIKEQFEEMTKRDTPNYPYITVEQATK